MTVTRYARKRSRIGVGQNRRVSPGMAAAAALLTAVAAALLVLPLFGYRVYVVTGDSMEGTFGRGALLVTKTVPVESLRVGDIITFRPPHQSAPVSHRITSVLPQPDGRIVFKTKGDHNEAPDPWEFMLDQPVQARYVAHLPYAGYLFGFLGLRAVRATLIAGFGLLVVFGLFSALWKDLPGRQASEQPTSHNGTGSVRSGRWSSPTPQPPGRVDNTCQ